MSVLTGILHHVSTSSSFLFTLQEFARELVLLVDVMGQIHDAEREARKYSGAFGWVRKVSVIVSAWTRGMFSKNRKKTPSNSNGRGRYGALGQGRPQKSKQGIRPVLRKKFCESLCWKRLKGADHACVSKPCTSGPATFASFRIP